MLPSDTKTNYMSIVMGVEPIAPVSFGVQLEDHITNLEDYIVPDRMYHLPVRWKEVEAEKGRYIIPDI